MKNTIYFFTNQLNFLQAQHVLSTRLQDRISNAEHIDQEFAIRIEMQDASRCISITSRLHSKTNAC